MTAETYIIGIDIGTTSTKVMLFSAQGRPIAQQTVEYPLLSPTPEVQEQDPYEILRAVVQGVQAIVANNPRCLSGLVALSFSAAMHSLIAVDAQGQPLTHSITWADRRSAAWADKVRQSCNAHMLYQRTGTPLHPMLPLVKLAWLRHEQPQLFNQAAKFISIKEYVLYHWFEQYVVDYAVANATGLFNMQSLDWDSEALAIAGISRDRLSQLVPTTHVLPPLPDEITELLGLPTNLPVVVGASDGVLANLGINAIAPGVVAVTVGTSGAVRATVDHPQTDAQERLFCYVLTEQHWVIGGAANSGGLILRWARDHLVDNTCDTARLLKRDPYSLLTAIADTVPPGAAGLIFHPYLAGERSPLWDANARGSFFGLALHHTKAHLTRAVLEGIVYNLYMVLAALQEIIGPAKSIQATGGFARSTVWRQILADVFDRTVVIPETYESSCFGAAVLGLYALGIISSLEGVADMIGETHRHQPIPENVRKYRQILPLYQHLLQRFKAEYAAIAAIQADLEQS
ncbi:gluconokinase [Sphaerothrix gracilis]|uniref:gluconokinase n=1 Tax=Sphaerothrix gracilis TaxID=3151835 RepID=UPI0031FDD6F5